MLRRARIVSKNLDFGTVGQIVYANLQRMIGRTIVDIWVKEAEPHESEAVIFLTDDGTELTVDLNNEGQTFVETD